MLRITLSAAVALSILAGCESMNHSSSDTSCCTMTADKDMSKMSKSDMAKCGDDMITKGNAMKADAMKMDAGAKKDDAMMKADQMIKEGQECQAKAAKM